MMAVDILHGHYGKLVLLLLGSLVTLNIMHMVLRIGQQDLAANTNYLKHVNRPHSESNNTDGINSKVENKRIKISDLKTYIDKINSAHIMDASGTYMLIPNIIMGADVIPPEQNETKVTICTHSTANNLHFLKDLSRLWKGPVSVTVFTFSHDVILTLYTIAYLHVCSDVIRQHVSFHIAFPISHPPVDLAMLVGMEIHCVDVHFNIGSGRLVNYADNRIPYPHNVLRNFAISLAHSSHVFVIDIDMVPSNDLSSHIQHFLHRQAQYKKSQYSKSDNSNRIAYVVPAFECNSTVLEFNKTSLLREWMYQDVRPFYFKVCSKCQKTTDYERWQHLPVLDFLDIGYILEWEDPWEPFYIVHKSNLPLYDERFKQYGFNRISQVCELYVVGYQFAVMNNAFIVHRGFKEHDKFHQRKTEENNQNRLLFRQFKAELKERYPESSREC